jgi:heptosyltransferase-2
VKVLIVKLGATGDVVRTTPLLRRMVADFTWLTAPINVVLLKGIAKDLRCFSWDDREKVCDTQYDLIINLEDETEVGAFVNQVPHMKLFGAYLDSGNVMRYTDDSRGWFDLSLISMHGREEADRLKYQNRRTYQDLLFEGLGLNFQREKYLLPEPLPTDLSGDVAIAPVAGAVWPMKNWAHYDQLKQILEQKGFRVNVLPKRPSLLEHLGDVRNHRCLVGGDSLPMHLALGVGTPCVTIFNCTSPWEIHDYGIQTKIISPLLGDFFYKRGFDPRATTAVKLDEVLDATIACLNAARPAHRAKEDLNTTLVRNAD